jgi:uncharacterized membrane protein YdcZ (DUF606 family)
VLLESLISGISFISRLGAAGVILAVFFLQGIGSLYHDHEDLARERRRNVESKDSSGNVIVVEDIHQ